MEITKNKWQEGHFWKQKFLKSDYRQTVLHLFFWLAVFIILVIADRNKYLLHISMLNQI